MSLVWKGRNLRGLLKRASDVLFDNTNSGLSATDVQGAIDEVASVSNSTATVTHQTVTMTGNTNKNILVYGKLCCFWAELKIPSGSYSSLEEIATGFPIPYSSSQGVRFSASASDGSVVILRINSSGKLEFYGAQSFSSQQFYAINIAYIKA